MPNLLFPYAGSKAILARWHVTLFPHTRWFVSVFGGTAAEFLYRKPTSTEVLNDLDKDLHNTFMVIRNPRQCKALKHLLLWTPDGREQFGDCKEVLDTAGPVRRAWAFLVVANSGDIRCSVRNRSWFNPRHRLYWLPERLGWWRDRLLRVKLECLPWQDVVDRYDREDGMLYLDPPYHPDTLNSNADLYRHVMTAEEHVELLTRLRRCQSRVMICGYPHPTYTALLSDWVQQEMTTTCRMGDHGPRKEIIWLNYDSASGGRIHA